MFLVTYRTSIEPWYVVKYCFIAAIISSAQPPRETACTHALNHTSRQNKLQNRSATCRSIGLTSRIFFSRIHRARIRYVFSFVPMLTFQWGIRNNWYLRAGRSGTLAISPAETQPKTSLRANLYGWRVYVPRMTRARYLSVNIRDIPNNNKRTKPLSKVKYEVSL